MTDHNFETQVISDPLTVVIQPVKPPESSLKTLLIMAWPLIISNGFSTIQITIDRIFLSRLGMDVASGATSAMMIYWLPFILLFTTAGYVATFVAQYTGASVGGEAQLGAAPTLSIH